VEFVLGHVLERLAGISDPSFRTVLTPVQKAIIAQSLDTVQSKVVAALQTINLIMIVLHLGPDNGFHVEIGHWWIKANLLAEELSILQ
jgi:hypothetical protein